MRSHLFDAALQEKQSTEAWTMQSSKMLKVTLGTDVLAAKGSMVAYQGDVQFHHEGAGSVNKMLKKMLTSEDTPLMRVSGRGEVFFARLAQDVFTVQLEGDALSVDGANLLAFDASLSWDIHRVQGAGVFSGGLYNVVLSGHGQVALTSDGPPMLLDCSQQPTFVDIQAAVAWSANLVPQVRSSMNVKSLLRGGSGEAFQYAFHGPGFVVVQPSESEVGGTEPQQGGNGPGGIVGNLFG
ncbi:MAG TPA: AIM24 family protein [Angustibacter sp.]|nr:AIM24 family protein [Angustibacter sp.]